MNFKTIIIIFASVSASFDFAKAAAVSRSSSPSTTADSFSVASGEGQSVKKRLLWDLTEDLRELNEDDEYFWDLIMSNQIKAADKFIKKTGFSPDEWYTETHQNLSIILSNEGYSLRTVKYLYEHFPELFLNDYESDGFSNIFDDARQEVINYMIENYSEDVALMNRIDNKH